MPQWFKAYLEGLPTDLAKELVHWLLWDCDNVQQMTKIIQDERKRRKLLGI